MTGRIWKVGEAERGGWNVTNSRRPDSSAESMAPVRVVILYKYSEPGALEVWGEGGDTLRKRAPALASDERRDQLGVALAVPSYRKRCNIDLWLRVSH